MYSGLAPGAAGDPHLPTADDHATPGDARVDDPHAGGQHATARWRGFEPMVAVPTLSLDFVARLRRIPANSFMHIPISQRLRMLRVARQCYNRMADGDPKWSTLTEAEERLITAPLPEGISAPVEVAQRLDLWEAGDVQGLLVKVEQQVRVRRTQRRRQRRGLNADHGRSSKKAKASKRLAADGAYRKAVVSIASDLIHFTPDEDRHYATEMIPRTTRPDVAFSVPPIGPRVAPPPGIVPGFDGAQGVQSPLKGVRFKKYTVPGPTGCPCLSGSRFTCFCTA